MRCVNRDERKNARKGAMAFADDASKLKVKESSHVLQQQQNMTSQVASQPSLARHEDITCGHEGAKATLCESEQPQETPGKISNGAKAAEIKGALPSRTSDRPIDVRGVSLTGDIRDAVGNPNDKSVLDASGEGHPDAAIPNVSLGKRVMRSWEIPTNTPSGDAVSGTVDAVELSGPTQSEIKYLQEVELARVDAMLVSRILDAVFLPHSRKFSDIPKSFQRVCDAVASADLTGRVNANWPSNPPVFFTHALDGNPMGVMQQLKQLDACVAQVMYGQPSTIEVGNINARNHLLHVTCYNEALQAYTETFKESGNNGPSSSLVPSIRPSIRSRARSRTDRA